MNQTLNNPKSLQQLFTPTERGVVGLVDDMLELCPAEGMELDWHGDHCRVRFLADKISGFVEVPLPRSAFRAFLARIAALCNEYRPNSVSPYGDQGEFMVASEPAAIFQATFTNTPSVHRLLLMRVPSSEGAMDPHPADAPGLQKSPRAKIAFLFPGQGAQQVGMAQALCVSLPAARKLFDEAAGILGYDLLEICAKGPKDRLDSTVVSQPAIYVASLAALESLRAQSPDIENDCIATAGLSLGEYTALTFAGAMSFADGLRLVKTRGEAMQAASDATPSGMVSVLLLPIDKVEELCVKARPVGTIQIANLLCPGNTVVSGAKAACDEIEKLAADAGAKTVRLPVAGAFHTDIMKPADQTLAAALEKTTLKATRLPVWSNVDAQPHTDPTEIRGLLVRQVVQPVQWETTIRGLLALGVEKFYEIGPQRVLAGLLKRVDRKMECVNIQA